MKLLFKAHHFYLTQFLIAVIFSLLDTVEVSAKKLSSRLIDRKHIDDRAFRIVESLQRGGFKAYLVGGCVRDILTGLTPKDFDIATNAQPDQVRRLIPNSYVIGRRFRLVLVKRGPTQFEVSTFRRNREADDPVDDETDFAGDNFFGTEEEDAFRRDFKVNAIFLDPISGKIIDYCGGLEDIRTGHLRMIGDPNQRLVEDPIRILRALRLSHKLRFVVDQDLLEAMQKQGGSLATSMLPRRREEYLKIMRLQNPDLAFQEAYDLGLLQPILPSLSQIFDQPESRDTFIRQLRLFSDRLPVMTEPFEFMSLLAWCFLLATTAVGDRDPAQVVNSADFENILKGEFGLFKQEVVHLQKSVELLPTLSNMDSFLRRGARRKQAFLHNEFLPMALELARNDFQITWQYYFWTSQLAQ